MVVLLNGAFGVGKTTVARKLVRLLPGSLLFDPEVIGFVLRRLPAFVPLRGRGTADYQDLALWRSLTVALGRSCLRLRPTVIVPMAFSNRAYLAEIRDGLRGRRERVLHFCLTAPLHVVEARLRARQAEAWCFRRAAECCAAHEDPFFAEQVQTEDRSPDEVAEVIAATLRRCCCSKVHNKHFAYKKTIEYDPIMAIKVSDEVWVITALLHREQPDREDFSISEIVDRAGREKLSPGLRPGVRVHATQHCVASLPPNPGRYTMLHATAPGRRRLFRPGDPVHPARQGAKTLPIADELPESLRPLLDWYARSYARSTSPRAEAVADQDPLLALQGSGAHLFTDETPDEYVARLRGEWP